MTQIRIMYWKEIPVQVQARDDSGVVSRQLHPRFQQGVDAVALFDGSAGADEYLMAWEWGQYTDADGTVPPRPPTPSPPTSTTTSPTTS